MTLQPIGRASSPDNFTVKLECAAETFWLVMESAPYAAVLIDREGKAKVTDFGIARSLDVDGCLLYTSPSPRDS